MGGTEIVSQWATYLKSDVLPRLSKPLVRALADFSLAVAEAGTCRSGRVAAAARGPAMPASRRRRWERWLASPRFDPAAVQAALPLASACYRPARPPGGMPRLVGRLLDRAAADAPAGCRPVVVADRGLSWPAVLDHCAARGWGYLLRLQGQTRARL